MDATRFDGIVRSLATGTTRRHALLGLIGAPVSGWLAHLGAEEAAAGCVKPGRKGCKGPRNRKCCQGAKCRGGTNTRVGRCVCERKRKKCGNACVNIQTDKQHCGRCHKRCRGGLRCKGGVCTGKLGCTAGRHFCEDGFPTAHCPGNQECACLTDVHGNPHCSDFASLPSNFACSDCTSNANCGPGKICVDGSGPQCGCPGQGEGTGNACVLVICGGNQ